MSMIGLLLALTITGTTPIALPNIRDQQTPGYDWQGGSHIVLPAHGKAVITKINPSSPSPFRIKGEVYICGPNCRASSTLVIKPEWCRDSPIHIKCEHFLIN